MSEEIKMADPKDKPNAEQEDFSKLLEDYGMTSVDSLTPVKGQIIDIIEEGAIIDIGQKTEGILRKNELMDWDGKLKYNIGDTISVICKQVNPHHGYMIVSKKEVDQNEGWDKVQEAYDNKTPVNGRIIKWLEDKRGYRVDMGVEMFLPLSQVDIKKIKVPQSMLGKEFQFVISRVFPKEMTGIISRRVLLEEERQEKLKLLFDSLNEGDAIKGVVTTIMDYGVFVDIGGIDGFVHKDNISYGRINHPKEKLRKGDEIETKVLEINREKNRISLGIKQRFADPWINIEEEFPVGKRVVAKVTKIVNFGAFIELKEGIEGLLHISDLTWEGKPDTVEEYVAVGDTPWVQVIELNVEERKIRLGLKHLEMRPEEKYMENHKSGEIVSGLVKKVLKSKVFVELEKGIEGVIKISDITYFRIDSPKEFLKEGDTIDAMIVSDELDPNCKVKLGLKQLSNDEWTAFFQKNKSGSIIQVTVKKVTENGVTVEITKNIEGFIRLNELDEKKITFEEARDKFKPGLKHEGVVMRTDVEKKRVYMSFKAVTQQKEKEEFEKYSKTTNEVVTTIGDLLQNEIDKKK